MGSSDDELIGAMRRHERTAFEEFFARFAPMLEALARLRRVSAGERESIVTEFLDDAAMRLVIHTTPVPRALAAYLAVSFKRWHLNRLRDDRRRDELVTAHAAESAAQGERAVLGASSEAALRGARGPGHESAATSPVLAHLVLVLENGLAERDRQLLGWLSQHVPQREIAGWLGVTHGALRVRVSRLRRCLRQAAARHAETLDGDAREELERLLRFRLEIPTGEEP